MHIILGVLGTIVTILILVNRLQENGIDIGWLNPFSWHRRRKFRKQYYLSPAYSLSSAMDVVALFMLAIAKADGDLSKEQKLAILSLFESEFKLTESEANALLGSSAHILGNGDEVKADPKSVISKSYESFTPEQVDSAKSLLDKVAHIEGEPSDSQSKLLADVNKVLPNKQVKSW